MINHSLGQAAPSQQPPPRAAQPPLQHGSRPNPWPYHAAAAIAPTLAAPQLTEPPESIESLSAYISGLPLTADLEREYWQHFPEPPEYAAGTSRLRWPPGFVGRIAQYLYCQSPSPVAEYAIATAIALFAGVCGRGWIFSETGLNHDIIVLGPSGTGKNIVHSGLANIARQLSGTPIATFIFPGKMASAQALVKSLLGNPCFLQIIGEVGKMYRAYAKSRHGDALDQLFTAKLDLWERSGPDGVGVGIQYSDAEKNVDGGVMAGIAHSTLGESTPEVFFGSLSTDMMTDGLLSRLWIFEFEGTDPAHNEHRLSGMPATWIEYLSGLVRAASGRLGQQPIQQTGEAAAAIKEFAEQCRHEKLNAGNDPARRQLWVRAYEKVIRLAGLLAVADNYINPWIDVPHVDWAISALLTTNLNIQRRVCDGDISDDADHTREQMILQRCGRWFEAPRRDASEDAMRQRGVIPRRFLQQEVASKDLFKKHRLGATTVFNLTMKSLVENGYLVELDKLKSTEWFGVGRGQCWLYLGGR